MAVANGQPQDTKKEFTPEQKRTFALLGVAGVLALAVGVMYIPSMLRGSSTDTSTATPATSVTPAPGSSSRIPPGSSAPSPTSPGGAGTSGASPGALASTGSGTTPVVQSQLGYTPPVARSRRDPFQPFVLIGTVPTPIPPPPAPTPIPEVSIPRPNDVISVPSPGDSLSPFDVSSGRVAVPGANSSGSAASSGGSLVLPSISIPSLTTARTAPQSAFPPPRSTESGGGGEPEPSFDKRLSGVIISNGVKALLEISRGTETVTHVVQPGDTVEGIQILNIERFNDGTRTVTRMTVRENGQDKYVELKAGPDRTTGGLNGPGGLGGPGANGRNGRNPFQ